MRVPVTGPCVSLTVCTNRCHKVCSRVGTFWPRTGAGASCPWSRRRTMRSCHSRHGRTCFRRPSSSWSTEGWTSSHTGSINGLPPVAEKGEGDGSRVRGLSRLVLESRTAGPCRRINATSDIYKGIAGREGVVLFSFMFLFFETALYLNVYGVTKVRDHPATTGDHFWSV